MDKHQITDDNLAWLRLALCEGIGPRRCQSLIDRFGSVSDVFKADRRALQEVPGIGPTQASRIEQAGRRSVEVILAQCEQQGIWLWFRDSPNYPHLLSAIPDPPLALFGRGEWQNGDHYSVAIVGTRRPSLYGRRQAARLAAALVEAGLVVVSGLARGIDAAAHEGALEAQGRTIAVLGSGLQQIYPREHTALAERIAEAGVLLTECPPQRQAVAGAFPQRNRVISGLSSGVVVVEAAQRSGALITAKHALEQGREVFAVPGPIDSPLSRGCHQLLRDGAKLVESADDVLEELIPLLSVAGGGSPPSTDASHGSEQPATEESLSPLVQQLPAEMRNVYGHIQSRPTDVESLAVMCGTTVAKVLAILTQLELKRLIRRVGPLHVERRFS